MKCKMCGKQFERVSDNVCDTCAQILAEDEIANAEIEKVMAMEEARDRARCMEEESRAYREENYGTL